MGTATLDRNVRQAREKTANIAHLQRLADAMAPDPTEWEFRGEMLDDDSMANHCACGHPIRYVFIIRRARDGAVLNIGSTCIVQSVPYLTTHGAENLAEALHAANEELKRLIRERQKEARQKKSVEALAALYAEARALVAWYEDLWPKIEKLARDNGHKYPPYRSDYLWRGDYKALLRVEKSLTPGGQMNVLRSRIQRFREEVAALKKRVIVRDCGDVWTDPPTGE